MNIKMRAGIALLALATAGFSQVLEQEEDEHFFMNAAVAVRLVGADSLQVEFSAGAEDMVNTFRIFPADNSDPEMFRTYERKAEAYLQERLPVLVDGKRIYLKVLRWKPEGKGRADGFDSAAIYAPQTIFLGGKLPTKRDHLDVTLNIWTERPDAGKTLVEFTYYEGERLLQRRWSGREKRQRFSVLPDSLRFMRKNPPPPVEALDP